MGRCRCARNCQSCGPEHCCDLAYVETMRELGHHWTQDKDSCDQSSGLASSAELQGTAVSAFHLQEDTVEVDWTLTEDIPPESYFAGTKKARLATKSAVSMGTQSILQQRIGEPYSQWEKKGQILKETIGIATEL